MALPATASSPRAPAELCYKEVTKWIHTWLKESVRNQNDSMIDIGININTFYLKLPHWSLPHHLSYSAENLKYSTVNRNQVDCARDATRLVN